MGLSPSLAVWPWTSVFNSLNLSVCFYQKGVTIPVLPISQDYKWYSRVFSSYKICRTNYFQSTLKNYSIIIFTSVLQLLSVCLSKPRAELCGKNLCNIWHIHKIICNMCRPETYELCAWENPAGNLRTCGLRHHGNLCFLPRSSETCVFHPVLCF